MATEAEKKLVRLVDRIADRYKDDILEKSVSRDGMMAKYEKDMKKAMAENKYLTISIIKKQMHSRIQWLTNEYVAKKMQGFVNSGELGAYLEDDDHDKYEELRLKMYLLYDALDYVFNDMIAFFRTIGLDQADVKIFQEIEEARKSIQKFGDECTHVKGSFAEDIINDEGERIYNFVNRRFPYIDKYMEKAYEKSKTDGTEKKSSRRHKVYPNNSNN